jgi:hypothetical protein
MFLAFGNTISTSECFGWIGRALERLQARVAIARSAQTIGLGRIKNPYRSMDGFTASLPPCALPASSGSSAVLAAHGESRPGRHTLRSSGSHAIAQVDCSAGETSRLEEFEIPS